MNALSQEAQINSRNFILCKNFPPTNRVYFFANEKGEAFDHFIFDEEHFDPSFFKQTVFILYIPFLLILTHSEN